MFDSIIKLIIGDLDAKKEYRQFKKRVDALPKDYRYAFRKIQHYIYNVGCGGVDSHTFSDWSVFINLIELFELSAGEGKQVLDVIGNDVKTFCDEFMLAAAVNKGTMREKLNKEIMEKFNKEGK